MANMNEKYPVDWNLACLYEGIKSPALKNDEIDISTQIEQFEEKYIKGLSISNLSKAVVEYDAIYSKIMKIGVFVSLYYQIRQKDPEAAAAYQHVSEWESQCFSKLCKFVVELQKLNYEEIEKLINNDQELTQYKAFIDEVFRLRDHTLSASEESILSKLGVITGNAWHKFHEGVLSRIEFPFEEETLTLSDIVEKANNGETEEIRKEASLALSEGLKRNEYALLSVFNNITLSHQIYGDIKKYDSPESQRYVADNISKEVVDNMIEAITESYASICHRYYKIKAKILGKDRLQYWDRCSHIKLSDKPQRKYTYDEAIDLVLAIFKGFSQKFYDIAKRMVNESWVDVYPKDGKISGAFACPLTSDLHPFILLNFYGGVRDILTIAHEFGHGIHQTLSSKVKNLVSDPPLNISETASTFAEKLTNEYFLKNEQDPKRQIELICSRLDDVMSTVFRQAAFFKFEQKIHRMRKEKELSAEIMDKTWREVLSESLGPSIELAPCVNNLWGYITHFTSCPFYVYSYSFGCLFVEGLYAEYKRSGNEFIKKYEEVLASGGTKTYSEIAGMFEIDANSKAFWKTALNSIEKEIDNLEALCDQTLCV